MDIPDIFQPLADPDAPETARNDVAAEARAAYDAPAAGETPFPFFADACRGIRLYQGNALELLRRARSEMFDLIFADPPYFLSNGGITCQSGKMVSVNKGVWDKAETFEEVHRFNREWLAECRRLLKPDGAIWVTGTAHNIYSVGFALQTLGFKILNDIAWHKVNPPPNLSCRYFTHATETVLWAAKSKKSRHTFHYPLMKQSNGGKQMQSLWHIQPPKPPEKRFGKHPTQKPEALLERILQAASSPGDLVLDPFSGSATTGVVAARLLRRFVGFEIETDYLEIARKRIQEELAQERLPAFANHVDNDLHGGGGRLWQTSASIPPDGALRPWTQPLKSSSALSKPITTETIT